MFKCQYENVRLVWKLNPQIILLSLAEYSEGKYYPHIHHDHVSRNYHLQDGLIFVDFISLHCQHCFILIVFTFDNLPDKCNLGSNHDYLCICLHVATEILFIFCCNQNRKNTMGNESHG